jgi:hypothetical protein
MPTQVLLIQLLEARITEFESVTGEKYLFRITPYTSGIQAFEKGLTDGITGSAFPGLATVAEKLGLKF